MTSRYDHPQTIALRFLPNRSHILLPRQAVNGKRNRQRQKAGATSSGEHMRPRMFQPLEAKKGSSLFSVEYQVILGRLPLVLSIATRLELPAQGRALHATLGENSEDSQPFQQRFLS
jgi:hypothetical protein